MSCPHCAAQLPEAPALCNHCGFDVTWVRRMLGAEWVRLERLTDPLNCLSLKEQRHLEVMLDEFERHFPQCFVAVYLGRLPSLLTARDLGFWLLNHGAFPTQQVAKRNDFGIALVVDAGRSEVALTLGYALESLISESELQGVLTRMAGPLRRHRPGQAVERAVAQLSKKLRQAGQKSSPQKPGSGSFGDLLGNLGLLSLRSGHRPDKKAASGAGPSLLK